MIPRVAEYPTVELTAGAAFTDTITIFSDDACTQPADLTGYTNFKWQGRDDRSDQANLIFDLGVTADTTMSVVLSPASITFGIPGSLTYNFPAIVYHDIRADDPYGNRIYFWRGKLLIEKGETSQ